MKVEINKEIILNLTKELVNNVNLNLGGLTDSGKVENVIYQHNLKKDGSPRAILIEINGWQFLAQEKENRISYTI